MRLTNIPQRGSRAARKVLLVTVAYEELSVGNQMLDFYKSVAYDTSMRTYHYYRVRSMVRFVFWGTVALGVFWLAKSSIESWDNYKCHPTKVIVEQNDTLWAIAERNCQGSIESAVHDLVEKRGTELVRIGQVIELTSKP